MRFFAAILAVFGVFINALAANCDMKNINAEKTSFEDFNKAFLALSKAPKDAALQTDFFLRFPQNGKMLNAYFGYGEKPAPMYGNEAPIKLFYNLDKISKECVLEKGFAVFASKPEPYDTTGEFVIKFKEFIKSNPDRFIAFFDKLGEKAKREFWQTVVNNYELPNEKDIRADLGDRLFDNYVNSHDYDLFLEELIDARRAYYCDPNERNLKAFCKPIEKTPYIK